MPKNMPSPRIPAPLKGADTASFAHDTVVRRLPGIIRRVLAENQFTTDTIIRLEALLDEIPLGKIRQFSDDGPGRETWHRAIANHAGENWLDVPWFFAETYFYRRILEATGYFRPGAGQGQDPFQQQKHLGLEASKTQIYDLAYRLEDWTSRDAAEEIFRDLLAIDLWGNQLDLSLWPVGSEGKPNHADVGQQDAHIITNDTEQVLTHLFNLKQPVRVDFLIDNAGFELVCDLCFADYLLSTQAAATIEFHLKVHPTFVSDATIVDVKNTLTFLAAEKHPMTRSLAARLAHHHARDRLGFSHHPFWTSPLEAWEMPSLLNRKLGNAQMVISKGDANYRRILGDRHWEYTVPFAEVVSYFPTSLITLRTLKSEVVVGLTSQQVEAISQSDANWLTNGRWGMIQFAPMPDYSVRSGMDQETDNRREWPYF